MSIGRIGGVIGSNTILSTYRYIAAGSETSLSGADSGGNTLIYTQNYEAVFLNGVRLARGLDYQATTGTSITGLSALTAGDIVEIVVFQNLDVVSVDYADVRFAADAPTDPVNGTIWIDSDATVNVASFALTDSPTFTGTPTAPTAAVLTNTTQIATTAFVNAEISNDAVLKSLLTSKGQIVGASASGTPVAIPAAGGNGRFLVSDSSTASGVAFAGDSLNNAVKADSGLTLRSSGSFQPQVIVSNTTNDATGPYFILNKQRNGAIVQSQDIAGSLLWQGFNGSGYDTVAEIRGVVDGTPGASSDMPGRIEFHTRLDGSSPLERLRIDNTGRISVRNGGVLEAPVVTNAQTASYTLVLADAGKLIEMNSASALTLTIPADASVAFPVGTKIDILQTGAGQVTIAGSGFTPNATPGLKISAQWGAASLIKRGTNIWVVIGNLSA